MRNFWQVTQSEPQFPQMQNRNNPYSSKVTIRIILYMFKSDWQEAISCFYYYFSIKTVFGEALLRLSYSLSFQIWPLIPQFRTEVTNY